MKDISEILSFTIQQPKAVYVQPFVLFVIDEERRPLWLEWSSEEPNEKKLRKQPQPANSPDQTIESFGSLPVIRSRLWFRNDWYRAIIPMAFADRSLAGELAVAQFYHGYLWAFLPR